MKKIISTVLVCVMLLGCMLVLASCGGPNSDPEKAKDSLEDEGYVVVPSLAGLVPGIDKAYSASKGSDWVELYYLTEDADLDSVYNYVEGLYNEAKEADEDIDLEIGKNDDVMWFGTSAAVKAAK